MDRVSLYMTVYFKDPFWVGVIERIDGNQLQAYKIVFGVEPHDEDVMHMINEQYMHFKLSPSVAFDSNKISLHFKRKQKEARKSVLSKGVGTKSQLALKQYYELSKEMKKQKIHQKNLEKNQLKFEQKQQKKREKHKGH